MNMALFAIAAIVAVAVALRIATRGAATAPFVPNPNNTTVVLVRGWNRTELEKILGDFLPGYELPASTVKIAEKPNDILAITFPNDINPDFLCYLVNYIQYPKDFELEGRSIGVLGRVVLTAAFGIPDPSFVGKQAELYVPAYDDQYDLVYAKVDSRPYIVSFTNLIWKPTDDARTPSEIAGLN